jgi:predicted ATPase/class 3 adenylate cyclase/Tfp pilus assembly protein PilF
MAAHALLVTDLVDSTLLVERLGDQAAAQIFAEHDRRARDLLARHGGREIDRTDGFLLLFDEAAQAAAFALAYHAALAGLQLSARAGLHVAPVLLRENAPADIARGAKPMEVEGLAKPLCARVMALARGGQTLLTAQARDALVDRPDLPAALEACGHYRLKGIAEPIEIFALRDPSGPASAAPADTDKAYRVLRVDDRWLPVREVRHNLPRERDAFVGRAADLAAIDARVAAGSRLVTVLGLAGMGKTRLARRYGSTALGDFPGGVFFCDLSEARTLAGVYFVVAGALEVPLGTSDPQVRLGHAIAARGRCLLILDNFEQVVAQAPASVGAWLDRAPDAAFLVTSRERLHLAGADVLARAPLAPDAEGVELFALRARAQRPDFALTEANRGAVQRMVGLLDGLPLAIELAAARIGVMSPAQLLERLADRFRLLAGSHGEANRHATLRGAIDWSWNLLAPWEQSALAQCAVFERGFTLEAAEAVLDLSAWPDAPPAIDAVQALVDKSLLRTWVPIEHHRYDLEEPYFGMYLSIHDYAAAKLAASGAAPRRAAEQRHGGHYAAMGSEARLAALRRHGGVARRRALALELDNLVAACRRALARGDAGQAIGALRAAWEVLSAQGPFAPVVGLGTQVAALDGVEPSLHAAAFVTLGRAMVASGRGDEAGAVYARALALARAAHDPQREAEVLTRWGNAYRLQGRMGEARQAFEQALALRAGLGEAGTDAMLLAELGIVQRQTGAMDEARANYEQALAIDRQTGDREHESKVLNNLAILHAEQARFDTARALFESSLALSRELGDRRQAGLALGNLGSLGLDLGRLEAAHEHCLAALAIHRDTGERFEEGNVLGNLGSVALARGQTDEARRMYEASLAISREVGNRRDTGVVLGLLGRLDDEEGRDADAQARYDEALAIHRAVGNRHDEGALLRRMGERLARQGRREQARAAYTQGAGLLRGLGERLELAVLLCARARLELDAGAPEEALQALQDAQAQADAAGIAADSAVGKDIAALRLAIAAAVPPPA